MHRDIGNRFSPPGMVGSLETRITGKTVHIDVEAVGAASGFVEPQADNLPAIYPRVRDLPAVPHALGTTSMPLPNARTSTRGEHTQCRSPRPRLRPCGFHSRSRDATSPPRIHAPSTP